MSDIQSGEKIADKTPSTIIQLFLTPYLEFSLRFGSKEKTLLDIACGNCFQKQILESRFKSVTFVDKDRPSGLSSNDSFLSLDLEKDTLPFKDKEFDVLFSFETIEHLEEDKHWPFTQELLRVSKIAIIGTVSTNGPNFIGDDLIFKKATGTNPYHKKEYSSWNWESLFSKDFICRFYHLALYKGFCSVEYGLDHKNGISSYVVLSH